MNVHVVKVFSFKISQENIDQTEGCRFPSGRKRRKGKELGRMQRQEQKKKKSYNGKMLSLVTWVHGYRDVHYITLQPFQHGFHEFQPFTSIIFNQVFIYN